MDAVPPLEVSPVEANPKGVTMEIVVPTADGGLETTLLSKTTAELSGAEMWLIFHATSLHPGAFDEEMMRGIFPAALAMTHDLAHAPAQVGFNDTLAALHAKDGKPVPMVTLADEMTIERERWWKRATEQDQLTCAHLALAFVERQINTACFGITSMMLKLSQRLRGHPDSFVQAFVDDKVFTPEMRDLETLFTPENIRRVIGNCPIWSEWCKAMFRQHVRMLLGIGAFSPDEVMDSLHAALQQGHASVGLVEEIEAMLPPRHYAYFSNLSGYPKRVIRRSRRVLVRSMNGFRRLCGSAAYKGLQGFLRGKPLVVRGARFNWRFKRRWSPILQGIRLNALHCPFTLDLLDKETSERVVSLCIYFDETPLVDMIAGIIMHIKTHEGEQRLIEQGNLYGITSRCATDPWFRDLKPSQIKDRELPLTLDDRRHEFDRSESFSEAELAARNAALPVVLAEIQRATMIPERMFAILCEPFVYTEESAADRIAAILAERQVI